MFPDLKILKIHLEQNNAIDFLRNLAADFCNQIEELWIDTNAMPEDQGQQLENDMNDTLAKFKNMKSLHFNPVFLSSFNMNHLCSECKNLLEIKILRII